MLNRLRDALQALPATVPGDHLTMRQCRDFVTDALPAAENARAEAHLAACPACSERAARAATLHQLAGQLRDILLGPGLALGATRAATPAGVSGATPDGLLRWRLVEDEQANLAVRLGSHSLELEGARLRLHAGDWQREVVLEQVAPDQVGAETMLSADERAEWQEAEELRVELVEETTE
jgi:anti-sigma factor RsiW